MDALDPDVLPACTSNSTKYSDPTAVRTSTSTWLHSTVGGGTVDYCGTLIRANALWYLTAIGNTSNPNKPSSNVTRTLEATVTWHLEREHERIARSRRSQPVHYRVAGAAIGAVDEAVGLLRRVSPLT